MDESLTNEERGPRDVDLSSEKAACALKRMSLNLARAWSLSDDQICGLFAISADELARWRAEDPTPLPTEQLSRISHVLGIWKALAILIRDDEREAPKWVNRPNSAAMFGGRPAIDLLTRGRLEDLRLVREYLTAMCY